MTSESLTVLEICAGGGGQLLGLEQAGFGHVAACEIDKDACDTLRLNRPRLKVIEGDVRDLDGRQFEGIDLLAGGVPCQPFSIGGQQLGKDDERDLFPQALRLVEEARPRAIMLENVKGLGQKRFNGYRWEVIKRLQAAGYNHSWWYLAQADHYGVPQLRPRRILVAFREHGAALRFSWPFGAPMAPSVATVLYDLVAASGWEGAYEWALGANEIAPTIVGGSRRHGGPDLGPTRAREAWKKLGVDGRSIAAEAPLPGHQGLIRLTLRMVARLQGFPDDWEFCGGKTAAYRQIGNAFPPPVARCMGEAIREALTTGHNPG